VGVEEVRLAKAVAQPADDFMNKAGMLIIVLEEA
jgi:hypothetical protein